MVLSFAPRGLIFSECSGSPLSSKKITFPNSMHFDQEWQRKNQLVEVLPVNRTANILFEVCLFCNAACLKHAHLEWLLLYTKETSKDLSCCKKSWLRRHGRRSNWWKNGHATQHVTYNERAISYLCVMSAKFRFSCVLFAKVRANKSFSTG